MEHNINIDSGSYEAMYNNSSIDERILLLRHIKNVDIDIFRCTPIYGILEQRKKVAKLLYELSDLTNRTYEYQVLFNELTQKIKKYFNLTNL